MNHDPDPNDNTPTLTAAESAAIEQGNADDAAAVAAAAPEPAAVVEPAPAAPDPIAAALAENAAAIQALADAQARQVAAQPAAAATETTVVPPRDFDAEHAALAERFDSGDLNAAELAAEARKLTLAEAAASTAAALTAAQEAQQIAAQRQSEEQADAAWKAATTTFFADPGNAAIADNEIKLAGFTAAVQVAAKEGLTDNAAILARARHLVTGIAPVDQSAALRQAEFDRAKSAGALAPTTLRDVPNTASLGDTPGSSLDSLDISSLEDKLFLMSDADRNRYLETAPGGLLDNQRATS